MCVVTEATLARSRLFVGTTGGPDSTLSASVTAEARYLRGVQHIFRVVYARTVNQSPWSFGSPIQSWSVIYLETLAPWALSSSRIKTKHTGHASRLRGILHDANAIESA